MSDHFKADDIRVGDVYQHHTHASITVKVAEVKQTSTGHLIVVFEHNPFGTKYDPWYENTDFILMNRKRDTKASILAKIKYLDDRYMRRKEAAFHVD